MLKTPAFGRDDNASLRVGSGTVSTSIDQQSVGGAYAVTHDNAAVRRFLPPPPPPRIISQLGAAVELPSLPDNWNRSSAPACRHRDGLADVPSRNSGFAEGNDEQISSSDELDAASVDRIHNFPFAISGRYNNRSKDDLQLTMSNADLRERDVQSSFRRRPLRWAKSAGSDDEPESPCFGDDLNFFHASTAHSDDNDDDDDDDDRRLDPHHHHHDDDMDPAPEVTSATWISLFRTFYMGEAAGQRPTPAPLPVLRRHEEPDIDDLLDRTLSTISEEGVDEPATPSELDDEMADRETTTLLREREDDDLDSSSYNNGSGSCDEKDDVDYSDVIACRYLDDAARYANVDDVCSILQITRATGNRYPTLTHFQSLYNLDPSPFGPKFMAYSRCLTKFGPFGSSCRKTCPHHHKRM